MTQTVETYDTRGMITVKKILFSFQNGHITAVLFLKKHLRIVILSFKFATKCTYVIRMCPHFLEQQVKIPAVTYYMRSVWQQPYHHITFISVGDVEQHTAC